MGKGCRRCRPPCHLLHRQIPTHGDLPLGGIVAERSADAAGKQVCLADTLSKTRYRGTEGTHIPYKASFKMQISCEATLPWEAASSHLNRFGSSSLPQPHGRHGCSGGTLLGAVLGCGFGQLKRHCGAAAPARHRPPWPTANSLQGRRPSRKAAAFLLQCRSVSSLFLRLPKSPIW